LIVLATAVFSVRNRNVSCAGSN